MGQSNCHVQENQMCREAAKGDPAVFVYLSTIMSYSTYIIV
jgi:hypothetical protein